jgi:hypothetical protein
MNTDGFGFYQGNRLQSKQTELLLLKTAKKKER